jgi:hypothetical protein
VDGDATVAYRGSRTCFFGRCDFHLSLGWGSGAAT